MKQTLILKTPEIVERACRILRNLDGLHEVVIRPHKEKRSINANALYWKRIDCIRMHVAYSTGQIYSADELHEWLKGKFLPTKTVEIGGEAQRCRLSTSNLNTKEFAEYMDEIDRYCIDRLNLYLPVPGMEDER